MVVLPAPVKPTIATLSPFLILIFTLFKEDDAEILKNGHNPEKDNVVFGLSASSAPVEQRIAL